MIQTILRRLLILPPALFLVHFLGFSYAHLVRPLRAARNPFLAESGGTSPLWTTYFDYLRQAFEANFGGNHLVAADGPETIEAAIIQLTFTSLGLISITIFLSIVCGVLLGIYAAKANPPVIKRWLIGLSTAGLAMPTFFIGAMFFAGWFIYARSTPQGTVLPLPLQGFGWDAHLIMPVLVLMLRPTVQIAQLTAGMLVEEFNKQYIVAARSFGHTWRMIRWKDAMANIIAPVALTIAGAVRLMVGELIVVEWLFQWPGFGRALAQTLIPSGLASSVGAAGQNPFFLNPPIVAGILAVFALIFLITDLIATFIAQAADPRLTQETH